MKLIAPDWLVQEGLRMLAESLREHPPGTCAYCDALREMGLRTSFAPAEPLSENSTIK